VVGLDQVDQSQEQSGWCMALGDARKLDGRRLDQFLAVPAGQRVDNKGVGCGRVDGL
jgi:hypothetical protein